MLKLQNISSYYGESVVVKGISMEIAEGSFYGILGKNGMGKTTLLKTMMGLMNNGLLMMKTKCISLSRMI